jgi:hypothetical protein
MSFQPSSAIVGVMAKRRKTPAWLVRAKPSKPAYNDFVADMARRAGRFFDEEMGGIGATPQANVAQGP